MRGHVRKYTFGHVCRHVRKHAGRHVCGGICVGMRAGMCVGMRAGMCAGMCVDVSSEGLRSETCVGAWGMDTRIDMRTVAAMRHQ